MMAMDSTSRLRSGIGETHNTEVINIRNCQSGLGIKIAGGRSALGTDFGIYIKKILSGGAANLDGRLMEGDQLLEFNGYNLLGVSNDKAMSLLRNAAQSNHAKLVVSRDAQSRQGFTSLMEALCGESSKSALNNGVMNGLMRSDSFGSSRASTPSPTMGSSIPAEIIRQGARAERAFQKAMQTGRKVKVYRGRIMLLGQDRAGKTSLRKSLLSLPFDPEQESTVGVEVDEVEKWMPAERKKGEDNIARFIFRGLRNDSTAADPNVEEVKTTDQLEEKKDHKEPKLSPDGKENLVDKNELSNELQRNFNLNFTELAARYSQSRPEDDIKSEEVILSLWDFAGQHLYYASHSVFLSGRAVYILVYNLNKNLLATAEPCVRQGVNDIRLDNPSNETNLDNLLSWLVSVHNIRSAANKNVAHQRTKLPYQRPPVIIVGTNLDQPFEELATTEKRIKDSIIDKEYVKHVITTFFAVDNSTENDEGVQKLRDKIMEVLEGEPYMPEEVPLRWFNFERAVDALVAQQIYFMDLDQLLSVIRQVCLIEDEEEVTTMLNFYHDLGVIVKHGRTVVLQAQWLIDLFKQLITVPPFDEAIPLHLNCWRELQDDGILREAPVNDLFSKFIDKGLCKQDILGMMEQHGLIAKFSIATDKNQDEQRYFVPTQLGSSPSELYEIKPSECDPCPLILHFLDGFVPHGLFPQLMSKLIHWGSKNGLKETPQLFNNGARLFIRKQITFALILICRKRFIKIVLKTRNPSSYKSQSMNASNKMAIEVRNFIERILDGFSRDLSWLSNLRYELSVVCTYCLECTRDLHKKTSCDQDDCLHLLRVLPGEELICLKNFCDETVKVPGWEMWFEIPHSQTMEPEEDTQIADGTSSQPETTTQRVKATKRKRNKNFTASDEEKYDVDEREESNEEEEEEDQLHEQGKPTLIKKKRKTEKGSKPLEDLVHDPSDSLRKICERFDTSPAGLGNYEDVAKCFGYNIFTARSRFKPSPDGSSKALILAIIAEHPHVTVESFARVVEKQARRKDVAILLREFDRK